jgi:3-deoxy-7-phosphoheptulonate synthase
MLVRLRHGLASDELGPLLALCRELGYSARFLDEGRRLLELSGRGDRTHRTRLEDHPHVVEVVDAGDSHELHGRGAGRPDTIVRVGGACFGGGQAAIAAGPCSVEDYDRLLRLARGVQECGVTILRGGAYKPRTSPYSFQGLGVVGLEMLAAVRAETGIAIVTEVLDPRDVERVAQVADWIQIGTRSATNYPLLVEVGRAGKPVLLKRGFGATVREFQLSAEYVLNTGNEQVVLCERGVRSYDSTTRNLLDIGAVAHLAEATHLPVIVDPSHAAGRADLVLRLARAGLAAGADGLIVEVHDEPANAKSDGQQAISLEQLRELTHDAQAVLALDSRVLVPHAGPLKGSQLEREGTESITRTEPIQ